MSLERTLQDHMNKLAGFQNLTPKQNSMKEELLKDMKSIKELMDNSELPREEIDKKLNGIANKMAGEIIEDIMVAVNFFKFSLESGAPIPNDVIKTMAEIGDIGQSLNKQVQQQGFKDIDEFMNDLKRMKYAESN